MKSISESNIFGTFSVSVCAFKSVSNGKYLIKLITQMRIPGGLWLFVLALVHLDWTLGKIIWQISTHKLLRGTLTYFSFELKPSGSHIFSIAIWR